MMRVLIQLVLVVATIFASWSRGEATSRFPWLNAPSCSTLGGTPRRLELADGSIVSLDVRSVARSEDLVFAAGRNGYVFPRGASARTSPTMVDSLIGVLINRRGEASVVLNPMLPQRAFHPRVAPAPNGSFHVLFVTGLDSARRLPKSTDVVTLWHATFTRGWWSRPSRVGRFSGAILNPELSSALLNRDDELSIAFPFIDNRSVESEGGAIVLRRRGGRWRADTLRTFRMPSIVSAAYDQDGSLVALLSLSDTHPERYKEKVWVARVDSQWSAPRYVAGDGIHPIAAMAIQRAESAFVVSWADWEFTNASTARLDWGRLDRTLRLTPGQRVDSGDVAYPFEFTIFGDRHPLWLYHGYPYGTTVAIALGMDTSITRAQPLQAPFNGPIAATLRISPAEFLLFTQKVSSNDSEPMAASHMTALEIRCPKFGRQ